MNRFADTLRGISGRLSIPQPARSRVLLEISADMEDLFALHIERGHPEEEAHRLTLESFELSEESLAALAGVHAGPVRRILDALPTRTLMRWEHRLLAALVMIAALTSITLARSGPVFRDAGPFVWPVLLAALASLGLVLAKFYKFYLKQDHRSRGLRRGLDVLLQLSCAELFLGFTGSWVEALRLSRRSTDDIAPMMRSMLDWALHSSALLQIALGLALLSALAWFFLAGKAGRIERDEVALFLES